MIVPVFKTGDRYLAIAMMGSTPIRFRHLGSLGLARDERQAAGAPLPMAAPIQEIACRRRGVDQPGGGA